MCESRAKEGGSLEQFWLRTVMTTYRFTSSIMADYECQWLVEGDDSGIVRFKGTDPLDQQLL